MRHEQVGQAVQGGHPLVQGEGAPSRQRLAGGGDGPVDIGAVGHRHLGLHPIGGLGGLGGGEGHSDLGARVM